MEKITKLLFEGYVSNAGDQTIVNILSNIPDYTKVSLVRHGMNTNTPYIALIIWDDHIDHLTMIKLEPFSDVHF